MNNTDTSELLLADCDKALLTHGYTSTAATMRMAAALKSRLQAEAPEDAEVAAIVKRMVDSAVGPYPQFALVSIDDVHTLYRFVRARTSQAEAQAPAVTLGDARLFTTITDWIANQTPIALNREFKPEFVWSLLNHLKSAAQALTTAAQASVLTEDDRRIYNQSMTRYWEKASDELMAARLRAIIDRLTSTVGAPAPAKPNGPLHSPVDFTMSKECEADIKQIQRDMIAGSAAAAHIVVGAPAPAPTQTAKDALIDALDKTGIPAAVERAREKAAPALTMPTQYAEVLKECADELACAVSAEYAYTKDHPAMKRRYKRDMEPVLKARAILDLIAKGDTP